MKHPLDMEYEQLAQNTKKLKPNFASGKKPVNLNKNRYRDIMAQEDTRVLIPLTNESSSTDYINANFVSSEITSFICTQSPLIGTFSDFWLMVWDRGCSVIVALNRLVENRTIKGDRYWPECEKFLKFENLTVELLRTLRIIDITIRRLKLRYNNIEREIYHIHYEGWPDFGVPESSMAIREIIRFSFYFQKILTSSSPRPVVVHCSAGIGRSGSFMTIASIMSNPRFKELINDPSTSKTDTSKLLITLSTEFRIPDIVLSFRQKRHPGIVQTQQQYNFIYTALIDELCYPSIVTENLKKVILWNYKKLIDKKRLCSSGPNLKSSREDYYQFLSDHTSNDLKYFWNRRVNDDFIECDSKPDRTLRRLPSSPLVECR